MNSKEILKRIEEIEARTEKATPGPWIHTCDAMTGVDPGMIRRTMEGPPLAQVIYGSENVEADGEFIAHSREDIPQLCKVVRQLVAQLEEAEAQCAAMRRALERVIEVGVGQTDASFSHMTSEDCALCEEKDEIAEAALAENDAGRAFFDRLRRLEAVAEAARKLHGAIYNEKNAYETWPDIMESQEVCEAGNRLREALAALEEENDGDL